MMDLNKLRALGNNFRDVRLLSLRDWQGSTEVVPRDNGGPYVIMQEGYDPKDLTLRFDEFLLGKSRQWISLGLFLRLPKELRRQEFVFGTAAEVMQLLKTMTGKAKVLEATAFTAPRAGDSDDDDLPLAIVEAKQNPASMLRPQ